jgi:AraC family transcriptional regulator, arabinose operon regulatory protein
MDDHTIIDPSQDPQVQRIFRKLAVGGIRSAEDTQVAPLFPGFPFDVRLVAGITPIEKDGPLDFFIDRPNGMNGWIINLTVDGCGQVFDGANAFTVEPGDLLMFPPQAVHYYGRKPDAEKWWHRWIYFQPRAYWRNWLQWEKQVRNVHLMRRRNDAFFSEMFRLFVEVEQWSVLPDGLSVDLAFNRLEHILLSCARIDRAAQNYRIPIDERVLSACTLISNNLDRSLGVKEIADHVCLSPSRLSHLFRKFVGTGILQWRDGQRVQYAMQILRVTNVPIKSLSQMVGYDDPLYFSRVFRRHAGMSPRDFRVRSMEIGEEPGDPAAAVLPSEPDPRPELDDTPS